jgi:hypothetical protein
MASLPSDQRSQTPAAKLDFGAFFRNKRQNSSFSFRTGTMMANLKEAPHGRGSTNPLEREIVMTTKFITTVAAGAVFATASVLAPAAFAQSAAQPAAPTTSTTNSPAMTAPENSPPAPTQTGSYITQQGKDQVSANTYIGQSVYNGGNQSIGKVSDLIMQKQGGIVAAVIGVGGFLGIGAKNVAVPIANISVAQNQDGTVKLSTSESADSLKAAPEFKTLEMQSAETSTSNMQNAAPATDSTSTGSTTSQ